MPFGEELTRLLSEVIGGWGEGDAATAARCTFGLTPRTRLKAANVRRRAAAEVMGVSPDHFRKTRERDLLDDLAVAVVAHLVPVVPGTEQPGAPVRPPDEAATPPTTAAPEEPRRGIRVSTLDDETEYSLRALIDGAQTVLVHGKNWINLFNQQGSRLAQVVRQGGTVRVLLVAPDPALAVGLYRASPEASGHVLVTNVRTALDRIADLRGEIAETSCSADATGRFELRFAEVVPQYSFIAAGRHTDNVDRGLVQIGFAYTRRGSDRFVLCLPAGEELDGFVAEFEAAWARGKLEGEAT